MTDPTMSIPATRIRLYAPLRTPGHDQVELFGALAGTARCVCHCTTPPWQSAITVGLDPAIAAWWQHVRDTTGTPVPSGRLSPEELAADLGVSSEHIHSQMARLRRLSGDAAVVADRTAVDSLEIRVELTPAAAAEIRAAEAEGRWVQPIG